MPFPSFWKDKKSVASVYVDPEASDSSSAPAVIHDGGLAYTRTQAANGSKAAYQEAAGAPVETESPLGYEVGWFTVMFVNINMLIGTGIFSTRKCLQSSPSATHRLILLLISIAANILTQTGSVGVSLILWFIGFLMAATGISIYLEFASYFPSRSGSEVVYLEQAYPRPKYFFPIAFAVQQVFLNFGSSNAIGK